MGLIALITLIVGHDRRRQKHPKERAVVWPGRSPYGALHGHPSPVGLGYMSDQRQAYAAAAHVAVARALRPVEPLEDAPLLLLGHPRPEVAHRQHHPARRPLQGYVHRPAVGAVLEGV